MLTQKIKLLREQADPISQDAIASLDTPAEFDQLRLVRHHYCEAG